MPFLATEIRQQLGLPVSCPSLEDIHQAAAARGLQFDPHNLSLSPAVPPAKRASSAKQKAAAINA